MYCRHCGQPVRESDSFCSRCGAIISKNDTAPSGFPVRSLIERYLPTETKKYGAYIFLLYISVLLTFSETVVDAYGTVQNEGTITLVAAGAGLVCTVLSAAVSIFELGIFVYILMTGRVFRLFLKTFIGAFVSWIIYAVSLAPELGDGRISIAVFWLFLIGVSTVKNRVYIKQVAREWRYAVYAAVMPVLLSVIIVIAGFLGFEYALFFSDVAEDAAGAFFFIIFTVGSYLFLYVLTYQYIFLREKHKGTRFLDMWCNMSLIPLLLLYMTTSFTSLIPLDGTGAGSLAAEFVRAKKERGDIRTQ